MSKYSNLSIFMKNQKEELAKIKELQKILEKKDDEIPHCTEYLNRMYEACDEVLAMCEEYEQKIKDKEKVEADKIKAEAKAIKEEEKTEKPKIEPADISEADEADDDDIWD